MQVWSSPTIKKNWKDATRSRLLLESNKWILVDVLLSFCVITELSVLPLFRLFNISECLQPIYRRLGLTLLVVLCISVVFHGMRIIRFVLAVDNPISKSDALKDSETETFKNKIGRKYYGPTVFSSFNDSSLCEPFETNGMLHSPTSIILNTPSMPCWSPQSPREKKPVTLLDLALSPLGPPPHVSGTPPWSNQVTSLPSAPNGVVVSPALQGSLHLATWSSSPVFTGLPAASTAATAAVANATDVHKSRRHTPAFENSYNSSRRYQYQCAVVPLFSAAQGMLNDQQSDKQFEAGDDMTIESSMSNAFSDAYSPSDKRISYLNSRDNVTEKPSGDYWEENKVNASCLDQWTLDLRKWLSGTIIRRVINEVDAINRRLCETSQEEAAIIGSTTLDTLQQLCLNKYQYLPTLTTLLTFLELTKNQGYLVNRLRELARGGCLEDFHYDSGSRSTVWPWKEHLPNDSLILLHLFSTYLDHRLPPHPRCLSGRVFSQLHVVRHPDKPDTKSKYGCQIYQASVQPPHFKLVLNGRIYSFPQGPKNLFHVLLMVFHHVSATSGKLRSISLDSSGLNVAWIFRNDTERKGMPVERL